MSEKTKALTPKTIIKDVEATVQNYVNEGNLVLPDNYAVGNAMRAANLILSETKDKNNKPALEVCTPQSISRALLRMIVLGMNPLKGQCYFIVYGNQLTCMESYHGKRNVVRRLTGYRMIAQVVYEDDTFEFEYDASGGKRILEHKSSLKNVSNDKIIGAYVVASRENIDGTSSTETEIMTMDEIRTAWKKSKINPDKEGAVHKDFKQQMCKRTVTNRLAVKLISETDDNSNPIMQKFAMEEEAVPEAEIMGEEEIQEEIKEKANQEEISFDDDPKEDEKPEKKEQARGRPKNAMKKEEKQEEKDDASAEDDDDPF